MAYFEIQNHPDVMKNDYIDLDVDRNIILFKRLEKLHCLSSHIMTEIEILKFSQESIDMSVKIIVTLHPFQVSFLKSSYYVFLQLLDQDYTVMISTPKFSLPYIATSFSLDIFNCVSPCHIFLPVIYFIEFLPVKSVSPSHIFH